MTLSKQAVYNFARSAGFPPDVARQMVAIAQRESSLNPRVVGTLNAEKETSYGLWQINTKDAGIRALLIRNGITPGEALFDPAVNARAAYLLWGGSARNLEVSWYINRFGNKYGYAEKYNAFLAALPSVDEMESAYSGLPVVSDGGGDGGQVVGGDGGGQVFDGGDGGQVFDGDGGQVYAAPTSKEALILGAVCIALAFGLASWLGD